MKWLGFRLATNVQTVEVTMDDANRDFVTQWVNRLRSMNPQAVAILLRGSHVRGDAGPNSDVDFDVLLSGDAFEAYPMYLEPDKSGTIRHISVAVQDLNSWLAGEDEPGDWSFGLGTRMAVKLLWSRDAGIAAMLDAPCREHPPAEPELEDFIEGYGKVLNAWQRGDEVGMRQAAQGTATLAPTLLRLLNDEVWPGTRREALEAAIGFPHAPEGYRQAMLRCLGLLDDAGTMEELASSTRLLAEGVVRLLRESGQFNKDYPEGDPFGLLANGMIEAYLAQMQAATERWLAGRGRGQGGEKASPHSPKTFQLR